MKKQFLLLTVLFMAFATVAFGQAPNLGGAPTALAPTEITATCVANAGPLSPVPGTEYTYTANIPTPAGGKSFHWFVTTNLEFIEAGTLTSAREAINGPHIAAAGSTYNTPSLLAGPGDAAVSITWKAFTHDPLVPVLLVIYVEDDLCDNNNVEAFLIRPVHAFTLDIANLTDAGASAANLYEICVSPVRTATYVITNVATGEGEIQFDYGTNYMFFIVTAANFSHSWLPRFQVDGAGLTGSRVISAVDWAYPVDAIAPGAWVALAGGGTAGSIWTGATPVVAQAASGSVGATGESIVVRVTIENNRHETITNSPITLAVDGTMYDAGAAAGSEYSTATLADIHDAAGPAAECPWYDDFINDVVTQVLTPRPDINAVDPTPFVPTDRD